MIHIKMKTPSLHKPRPRGGAVKTHPTMTGAKSPSRPARPKRPGPGAKRPPKIATNTNPIYEILRKM